MIGIYDFTTQPSILIQGAMDTETEYLIEQLKERNCVTIGNWKYYTGFLGENEVPVIVSRTYMGIVNAAAATTLAINHFCLNAVINQGIAGGHDTNIHLGDIVLGTRVVPMSAMMRPYAAEGEGFRESDFEPLPIEIYNKKKQMREKVEVFPCDERLLTIAETVDTNIKTFRGVLGSADEWNNQIDRIALLRERYQTAAEEMESAAVAQLCLSYGIPFIGIRIISNSIVNAEEYDESVAKGCQRYIVSYVEAIQKSGLFF